MNASPLLAALALLPSDWPQYAGAAGDRTSSEELAGTEPRRAWSAATPGGFSSFAVANGRAFTLVLGERDGKERELLLALDAASGKELWSSTVGVAAPDYDRGGDAGTSDNEGGDGPRSTPSCAGERVYTLGAQLVLSSFEQATGALAWRHDLVREYDGRNIRWQNAASPLVEGGLVLAAGGGPGRSLLAFDADTGALAWAVGDELMTHATPVAATIAGRRQVVFLVQSGLVAVDPATGAELWRAAYEYRTSSAASPVVWEDVVYVSAGYGVGGGAFRIRAEGDALEPEPLWRERNDRMNHWSTPVCRDGFLYGMFSFKDYGDGPLQCVDVRTGEVRWSEEGFGPGNCILVGDTLVALGDAGEVVLVEPTPEAYRERAREDVLDGKCWSSPAFSDGQLYVRSTAEGVRLDFSGAE